MEITIKAPEEDYPDEQYEIESPAAAFCLDFILIMQDLEDAYAYAMAVINGMQKHFDANPSYSCNSEEDRFQFEPLWVTALVKYTRCYGKGYRHKLDPKTVHGTGKLYNSHKFFADLRDKHVVHPVNTFETAKLCILREKDGTMDVGGFANRHFVPSPSKLAEFIDVVNQSHAYCWSEYRPTAIGILNAVKTGQISPTTPYSPIKKTDGVTRLRKPRSNWKR